MNLQSDIKATFDQITFLNTGSGKIIRLYQAYFDRLSDLDGIRFCIVNFYSEKDEERAVK